MYARVASFEHGDTNRVDELIATIKARAEAGQDIPDAKRVLVLTDRAAARMLGISFFETEQAIREAEPVFERMGQEIPEDLRGKRTSVAVYEAAIVDVAGGAAAARMSTLEGAPEGIDDGLALIRDKVAPAASDVSGWRGIIALVDRTSGRSLTITFWDSEESLAASDAWADKARAEAASTMAENIVSVERYEVALDRVLAATSA